VSNSSEENTTSKGGVSYFRWIGGVLAALSSYTINKSILWAIFHSFLGWIYLIYLLLGFGGGIPTLYF